MDLKKCPKRIVAAVTNNASTVYGNDIDRGLSSFRNSQIAISFRISVSIFNKIQESLVAFYKFISMNCLLVTSKQ